MNNTIEQVQAYQASPLPLAKPPIKKHRRSHNRIHKKYRCYRADIWTKLALKGRNNYMTNLIAKYAEDQLGFYIRRLPKKQKHIFKTKFDRFTKRKFTPFNYQLTTTATHKKKKKPKRRGVIVKLRRQISLFYGGGRIRSVTFRRYSQLGNEKAAVERYYLNNNVQFTYRNKKTYASIVESRLDVLLLRTNLVDSIYEARQLIFHRKCLVDGKVKVKHPSYLVGVFQQISFRHNYISRMRQFLRNKLRRRRFIGIPKYLYVHFGLLIAFKIDEPITMRVAYPFTNVRGGCAIFRKCFINV